MRLENLPSLNKFDRIEAYESGEEEIRRRIRYFLNTSKDRDGDFMRVCGDLYERRSKMNPKFRQIDKGKLRAGGKTEKIYLEPLSKVELRKS